MFLSKLLSGRNVAKTKLELLTDAWTRIQKYYETADDPLKDAVDLTPIPQSLQSIVKLIQAEEIEYQRTNGTLETGPCLEYLLQKRVLEELAEFAKVDTPYGMRVHCLRFFCSLVTNVHAQLLPERAVHVPLQKLITSSHRLISRHYEELATEIEVCSEERLAAISELSLELVKLMHGIFAHFKGPNAALMDLFFERGWCRGRGENVWRSSKDGRTLHRRRESVEDKIAWDVFLTPRFDMFQFLIDLMNIPGETGEIAREAILFALRLLDNDPEYVCYIVEYSNFCEIMAERLALFFAHLPKNTGAFSVSSNNRINSVRPSRRNIRFSIPAIITNNSLIITVNAQSSFKKKRRKKSPFDVNFLRTLEATIDRDSIVDEFYSFWEYLNDVARVAEKRLLTALMAQLTTTFWHPVICTALSSPSAETSIAATAYTTEMIRSLTDQRLLHVFLVVLLGEDSGIGKDIEAEVKTFIPIQDLIDDDKQEQVSDTEDEDMKSMDSESNIMNSDELTLRLLLINRMDSEIQELSLATLRLFDTILDTYNQFAVYNLVLRNYLDISPDGEYIETEDTTDTSSLGAESESTIEDPKVDDLAVGEKENTQTKTEKVRWLVERVLSLLPLEDELERMKSSSFINPDAVVPGNSYDIYFHEAQERLHYALIAKNFWQSPYPPIKTHKDLEREAEDRQGRPARPTSIVGADQASIITVQKFEAYEGLFLSRIFDQFQKILELPLEQNLLVTSILQKIAGIVDLRTDGVICDWRAVRVGVDGALYGGVWALPSAKSNRRSLYALLEQVTFEALKRAQLVPNFETRISLAKSRDIISTNQMQPSVSDRTQSLRDHLNHPSLSKLVFSKGSTNLPNASKKPPGLSPLRTKELELGGGAVSPSSPSSTFFQNSQRTNTTPVTMTNPFAKLSNFVHAYIVLQEFCKELAAVVLVRHATNYREIGLVRKQRESLMMVPTHRYLVDDEDDRQGNFEKWKNRISVMSTLTDWKSVHSLDTIDEAITARVPSRTTGSIE